MFSAQLEDWFRAALGSAAADPARRGSIRFAIDFTRLLAGILTEGDISERSRVVMHEAISARTDLKEHEIHVLLGMALTPQNRVAIDDDDLRAFGARFGAAEEESLRAAVAEEIDLAAFASRYGEGEALLLLDSLFQVCAVDGRIDRAEIGRLTRAAKQLQIDPMLIGALFRKHDARHAAGELTIELQRDRYVIGRATHHEIPLPDPQIALQHVELIRTGDGWRAVDLRSGRPTLVNGHPITSAPLNPGDELRIGSTTLILGPGGCELQIFGVRSFSALSVRNLSRRIGRTILLDDISFTVFTGEVIAVVGPSGSGKTTLLNAIAGIAPASRGDVIFDGRSFHRMLAHDRSLVGIVPQDDVVHAELTVEESLWYSGRLRLPPDVSRRDLWLEVERVLQELDIAHIRRSRIGDAVRRGISGGQRKRVNLGQELLTQSTRVLFLDEPTSGLDPQTAQDIVSLIRQLADGGRIVFLVTHDVTPSILSMVDHLMVLAPGGRLAWFGPPAEAPAWFGVHSTDAIFAKLPDRSPEEWSQAYREGPAFRTYVRTREHLLGLDGVQPEVVPGPRRRMRRSRLRQLLTLTSRYCRTKRRDWSGLLVLLAQAPILGLFMWVVFPAPDPPAMFMMALSSLWFGASASVRELIVDRAIWRREARVGLSTLPYLASKVWVLGSIVALQCTTLATMCFVLLPMYGEYGYSWLGLSFVCSLTGWIGMAIGLYLSARTASSEAAVGALPLVLIPQITFSGLIVKVKEMGVLAKALSYLMVVRYSFEAVIKTGERLTEPLVGGQQERVAKPLSGVLYNLGFKQTAAADDMGIPLLVLLSILLSILGGLLLLALIRTRRTKEGS
ncbi:MAG TPA: ATP-binding cassette domain-containing protein [Deltaproteobacteria bacterium]|nr:ATP-binding cassette domain-containing protein [Deltaproteobacteria bacterium]